MDRQVYCVNVFTYQGTGGNLVPIVMDAVGMTDDEMREIARVYQRESAFVLPAPRDVHADFELKFFVPEHEMEMCGHATVGTAWILRHLSLVSAQSVKFLTKSGIIESMWLKESPQTIAVSQPAGSVELVTDERLVRELSSVLDVTASDSSVTTVQNACTSRTKTAIHMNSERVLNSLTPKFMLVKGICGKLGSTGLYPYALVRNESTELVAEARQFPKASGYPEDAATGIAAAALAYALAQDGQLMRSQRLVVRQGRAMGFLSEIMVQLNNDGCWISGACTLHVA